MKRLLTVNRLADLIGIIGVVSLTFCCVMLVIYGEKNLPNWMTSRVTFAICGSSFVLTLVSLAMQKSWGQDKANKRVNAILTVWIMIIVLVNLFT